MSTTKIEWTDAVWNPVTGCTKVSAGCKNCYAERLAKGRLSHLPEYDKGFTNVVCHQDRLYKPTQWKKPRKIFVNSMSDLFHEDVPFHFINRVFITMFGCEQHTFQILTKRPGRAIEFFKWVIAKNDLRDYRPAANIWIGVSVEDQQTANERIPLLLEIPAAVRFLSCEPLLGEINFSITWRLLPDNQFNKIDWVIVGGESGPHARPMHPDWVRSIRDHCKAVDVTFFFKQWGEWKPIDQLDEDEYWKSKESMEVGTGHFSNTVFRLGKKASGSLLDGKEYKEFPNK